MTIEDGGIYDVMVMNDVKGELMPHPVVHRGVLVRKRNELLVVTDMSGSEVTESLVLRGMNRVPRASGPIYGIRAFGSNADTFRTQSWVLFPVRVREPS